MKRNRNKIRRFFTAAVSIVAAFLFNISAYAQNIWRVDASVTQCGDGTSWPTAFRYLQDALNNVNLAADDQIWVAAGTYFVDQDCANPDGTGARASTFELVPDVWLLGGFDGTEMDADERDPLVNITILSGAMAQGENPAPCPVVYDPCQSGPPCQPPAFCQIDDCCRCRVCDIAPLCCNNGWDADPCDQLAAKVCGGAYHVVTAGAEITDPFTTIIDGFTIQDGTATGPSASDQDQGGGMLITGQPSVIRCTFTNNTASGVGGAVSIVGAGIEPQLINCEFRNNPGSQAELVESNTTDGGGLANHNATPTLTNCLFTKNEATHEGGAIFNFFPGECVPPRGLRPSHTDQLHPGRQCRQP